MKAFPFCSIISVVLSSVLVLTPVWAQAPSMPGSASPDAQPDALQLRILNKDSLQAAVPGSRTSLNVEVTENSGAVVPNAAVTCRLPDSGPTGTFGDGTHAAVAYTDDQGHAKIEGIQWANIPGSISIRLTATKGTAHTGILVETNLTVSPAGQTAAGDAPTPRQPISQQRSQTVVAVPSTAETQPVAQPVVSEPTVSVTRPANKPIIGTALQPGQPAKKAAAISPAANPLTPGTVDPAVSVTHTSASEAPHSSSHVKWYVLAAVAVAAGAGAAFAMKGKSTSSTTSNSSSLSIGNPTVSVGHP